MSSSSSAINIFNSTLDLPYLYAELNSLLHLISLLSVLLYISRSSALDHEPKAKPNYQDSSNHLRLLYKYLDDILIVNQRVNYPITFIHGELVIGLKGV